MWILCLHLWFGRAKPHIQQVDDMTQDLIYYTIAMTGSLVTPVRTANNARHCIVSINDKLINWVI